MVTLVFRVKREKSICNRFMVNLLPRITQF